MNANGRAEDQGGGVVATGLIAIMDADGQGQAQEMIYRYLTTLDA